MENCEDFSPLQIEPCLEVWVGKTPKYGAVHSLGDLRSGQNCQSYNSRSTGRFAVGNSMDAYR